MVVTLYFQSFINSKSNSKYFDQCVSVLDEAGWFNYSVEPIRRIYIPVEQSELEGSYEGVEARYHGESLVVAIEELEIVVTLDNFDDLEDLIVIVEDRVTSYQAIYEECLNEPRV